MQQSEKKCIVITVRKTFMKGHPKAGLDTGFPVKIRAKQKRHTVRAGIYWRKVVDKVNAGTHYLSVRTWDGRPYVDKGQTEVARFEKLGYQEIEIDENGVISIDGFYTEVEYAVIATNDGLSLLDFLDWFGVYKRSFKGFKGGIIHFDPNFKY